MPVALSCHVALYLHLNGSSFKLHILFQKNDLLMGITGARTDRRGQSSGLGTRPPSRAPNCICPAGWPCPPCADRAAPAVSSHSPENRSLRAGSRPPVFRLQHPRTAGPQRGRACRPGSGRPRQRCDPVVGSPAFLDAWAPLGVTMDTGFKRDTLGSLSLVFNHCQPNSPCSHPIVITNLLSME